MLAIYKKEMHSYFNSMLGYIFITFFLAVVGIYMTVYNFFSALPNFEYVLSSISFLFIVIVPILTMRIMAEESRLKTEQLLFTSPISITSIIMGKFMAVISMFGVAMLITCFYPILLSQFGNVSLLTSYSSILGFFLLGGAYMALGMFISSLTESQVVSAVMCFVAILATYLMSGIASLIPADNRTAVIVFSLIILLICTGFHFMMNNMLITVGFGLVSEIVLIIVYFIKPSLFDGSIIKLFDKFSVVDRYQIFALGMIDISAIVYYLSIIFIFIFLTIQSIQKRRWS